MGPVEFRKIGLGDGEQALCSSEVVPRRGASSTAVLRVDGERDPDLTTGGARVLGDRVKEARRRTKPCERPCTRAQVLDLPSAQSLLAQSAGGGDCVSERSRNLVMPRREFGDPGTTLCVQLPTRLSCQQDRANAERDQKEQHEDPDCLQGGKSSRIAHQQVPTKRTERDSGLFGDCEVTIRERPWPAAVHLRHEMCKGCRLGRHALAGGP